jgi:uncharacterized protein
MVKVVSERVSKHRNSLNSSLGYLTKFVTKYDSDNKYILVNALSGAVDIIDGHLYKKITPGKDIDTKIFDSDILQAMKERMYLFESHHEEETFLKELNNTYLKSDDKISSILICPTFSCNLKCNYCFEGDLTKGDTTLSVNQMKISLDACEKIIGNFNLKPRFGIFGGEPFLIKNYNQVKIILDWANSNNLEVSVPTNATQLEHFIEYLQKNLKRGVLQITLDGNEDEHNSRRGYEGKSGFNPFHKTTTNIDLALKAGLKVFLRINLDKKNIGNLDFLINFIKDKGWQKFENFRVGITNIVDHKSENNDTYYDEYELYSDAQNILEKYPEFDGLIDLKMLRVLSHIEAILTGKKQQSSPKLYYCEACKSQFVFGADGLIYPCTEVMGDENEAIGRFLPELVIDDEKKDLWQKRNVFNIKECSQCEIFSFCGGGCAVSAKYIKGNTRAPYCGNAKEILKRFVQHFLTKPKA